MLMLTALGVYLAFLVLLFLLRKRVGLFWTAGGFFAATMVYMKMGFDPPVPASVVAMYALVLVCAVLLYVTSSEEGSKAFFAPIVAVIVEKRLRFVRLALLLALPGLIAWQSYEAALPPEAAPPKTRSVHPSPPNTITYQGPGDTEQTTVDIIKDDNPLRALETSDPDAFEAKVELGKKIYYENCYYCHGDDLAADGHYANAFSPPPANFQDPGVIPMLQETFLFWRIAKGGPGLPDAGTPWDSSMPVWEKMLSADEIWSVILFLSDYTGYKPRGREEHEGAH